jgi:hypothetical protein
MIVILPLSRQSRVILVLSPWISRYVLKKDSVHFDQPYPPFYWAFIYEQLNTASPLKFNAKVQQLITFPRTPIKFKIKVQHYNTFPGTHLKLLFSEHP